MQNIKCSCKGWHTSQDDRPVGYNNSSYKTQNKVTLLIAHHDQETQQDIHHIRHIDNKQQLGRKIHCIFISLKNRWVSLTLNINLNLSLTLPNRPIYLFERAICVISSLNSLDTLEVLRSSQLPLCYRGKNNKARRPMEKPLFLLPTQTATSLPMV